jgi:hypothetical protein
MAANRRLWLGLVLLALALAGIVQWTIGWPQLLAPWRTIAPITLALATLLTLRAAICAGAAAVRLFSARHARRFSACLKLTLLHNLFNNLLPMRTGEAVVSGVDEPLFRHVPLPCSLAALLWFRLMDLHALAAVALIAVGGHRWLGTGG